MLENHTGKAVTGLSLRAEKFVNALTGRTVDSEATWASATDERAKEIYLFDLDINERRAFKVLVTRVWDAGNCAPVFLGKHPIGSIRAERLRVPFGIALADAGTESRPLHADQTLPLVLTLNNGDALTYGLNWELVLEGDNVGEKQEFRAHGDAAIRDPFRPDLLPSAIFPDALQRGRGAPEAGL